MMDAMAEAETGAAGEPKIVDNNDEHRYELWLDGTLAGFLEYTPRHRVVVLNHTEIDTAFEGRGLGSTLIAAAIKDIRARGLRLYPECPFVQAYLERHPEDRDIALPVPDRTPD